MQLIKSKGCELVADELGSVDCYGMVNPNVSHPPIFLCCKAAKPVLLMQICYALAYLIS